MPWAREVGSWQGTQNNTPPCHQPLLGAQWMARPLILLHRPSLPSSSLEVLSLLEPRPVGSALDPPGTLGRLPGPLEPVDRGPGLRAASGPDSLEGVLRSRLLGPRGTPSSASPRVTGRSRGREPHAETGRSERQTRAFTSSPGSHDAHPRGASSSLRTNAEVGWG